MDGDKSGVHKPQRFFRTHLPRGRFAAFLVALVIYLVLVTIIMTWLAIHGEATTQRRIALSPSITVPVERPAAVVEEPVLTEEPVAETPPVTPPTETTENPEEQQEDDAPLPVTKPVTVTPAPAPSVETKPAPAATAPAEAMPASVAAPAGAETTAVTTPTAPVAVVAPAWQANARTFDKNDKRPRIGLIITNLGMATSATRTAVETLPAAVTLAFQSIAPGVTDWIAKARTNGHEALLAVPMEPKNYPQNDPGPQTLLTTLPAADNAQRLEWALARSNQIIGIIPSQGEQFITSEKSLAPILDIVKQKGLVFVDGTLSANSALASLASVGRVPTAQADSVLDAAAARTAIDQALSDLETQARANGHAIGIALPYPVTFERLAAWIKTLPEKNIALAPISTFLVNTAPEPAATPATTTISPMAKTLPQPITRPVAAPPLSRITPAKP